MCATDSNLIFLIAGTKGEVQSFMSLRVYKVSRVQSRGIQLFPALRASITFGVLSKRNAGDHVE